MGYIILDITMSLDGFIAGPNINSRQPMGEGGQRLHNWLFTAQTPVDAEVVAETVAAAGAVIVGGRTYITAVDGVWNSRSPFDVPAFVLLKMIPSHAPDGFTFVTDGIESALRQAQAVAEDKNVWIMGGAQTIQHYIKAGLFDELHIHIAPVLLGNGTKLFAQTGNTPIELERISIVETPAATHFKFRAIK